MRDLTHKRNSVKIIAGVATLFILTILVLAGPANALNIELDLKSDKDKVRQGKKIEFTASVQVEQGDELPDEVTLILYGEEDFNKTCSFDIAGKTKSGVNDGCHGINVKMISKKKFGHHKHDHNHTHDHDHGDGYKHDSDNDCDHHDHDHGESYKHDHDKDCGHDHDHDGGYGYDDIYNYGYGYGYGLGPINITYKITLHTQKIPVGNYTTELEVVTGGHVESVQGPDFRVIKKHRDGDYCERRDRKRGDRGHDRRGDRGHGDKHDGKHGDKDDYGDHDDKYGRGHGDKHDGKHGDKDKDYDEEYCGAGYEDTGYDDKHDGKHGDKDHGDRENKGRKRGHRQHVSHSGYFIPPRYGL
jgi:hypothetical protein